VKIKSKRKNALLWLYEPLEDDPRFVRRRLFSTDAAYLDGKLYLAVKDGTDHWSGLLVCTSRDRHAAILADYPQFTPHVVLGKWLYLSQSHPEFESLAPELVSLALNRDPRLGVEPPARRVPGKPKAAARSTISQGGVK
jgi:hypothetical protein